MVNYHLISQISLGDEEFLKTVLHQYKDISKDFLEKSLELTKEKKWSLLHLRLISYRDKIAHLLNKPSLNRVNAVLEIMQSSLNSSAKLKAYNELISRIKKEMTYIESSQAVS